MRCDGFNESTGRPCQHRALWQLRAIGMLGIHNTCQYHIVDFLEDMTNGNVPVTVLSLVEMGLTPRRPELGEQTLF